MHQPAHACLQPIECRRNTTNEERPLQHFCNFHGNHQLSLTKSFGMVRLSEGTARCVPMRIIENNEQIAHKNFAQNLCRGIFPPGSPPRYAVTALVPRGIAAVRVPWGIDAEVFSRPASGVATKGLIRWAWVLPGHAMDTVASCSVSRVKREGPLATSSRLSGLPAHRHQCLDDAGGVCRRGIVMDADGVQRECSQGAEMDAGEVLQSRGVLKGRVFFFLLRTAPRDHQPPTANSHQLPTATNRQPPTATNRQPPLVPEHFFFSVKDTPAAEGGQTECGGGAEACGGSGSKASIPQPPLAAGPRASA